MFLSPLFAKAIAHHFELTELKPQAQADEAFLSALAEVRLGLCTSETGDYLQSLSRPLPAEKENQALHVFFKKIPSILFNGSLLDK